MSKHLRDDQITLRLSRPLREELEKAAQAEGSRITGLIRKILIEHAAQRMSGRQRTSGEGGLRGRT